MKTMSISSTALVAVFILIFVGCKDSGTEMHRGNEVVSADSSFVDSLKIITRPITDSNAMAIAVLASGGKAITVVAVTYEGIPTYRVQIQTGSLYLYLYIRISDGALIKDDENDGENH